MELMISLYESNELLVVVVFVIVLTRVFMCSTARLVIDSITQRPKGFGFVRFGSELEAQNALRNLNGKV